MKVVLFCGGLGTRLYPYTEKMPKPLIQIGGKPILLLLMKYYAHFGHKDFILCLGYKGEEIKKFFLNYDECLSGDFTLSNGGKKERLSESEIEDWKITFAETGVDTNQSHRLKAVQKYIGKDEHFLANYSDGLTDLHLPDLIDFSLKHGKIACLITVKPSITFHAVSVDRHNHVKKICNLNQTLFRMNGGFFVFKNEIFDYINPKDDLVNDTFQRLAKKHDLIAYRYNGFWASLDTYKDKQRLEELASKRTAFWEIWNSNKRKSTGNKLSG
jgi:glucose-1-phosphate cytidylyltransferase